MSNEKDPKKVKATVKVVAEETISDEKVKAAASESKEKNIGDLIDDER